MRRHVGWDDYTQSSGRAHVLGPRGARLVGRTVAPGVEDFIDASFRGPFFSGGRAWWAEWSAFVSGQFGVLHVSTPTGRDCRSSIRDLQTHHGELDVAVLDGEVFYAGERGVFRADRASLELRRGKCLD